MENNYTEGKSAFSPYTLWLFVIKGIAGLIIGFIASIPLALVLKKHLKI